MNRMSPEHTQRNELLVPHYEDFIVSVNRHCRPEEYGVANAPLAVEGKDHQVQLSHEEANEIGLAQRKKIVRITLFDSGLPRTFEGAIKKAQTIQARALEEGWENVTVHYGGSLPFLNTTDCLTPMDKLGIEKPHRFKVWTTMSQSERDQLGIPGRAIDTVARELPMHIEQLVSTFKSPPLPQALQDKRLPIENRIDCIAHETGVYALKYPHLGMINTPPEVSFGEKVNFKFRQFNHRGKKITTQI